MQTLVTLKQYNKIMDKIIKDYAKVDISEALIEVIEKSTKYKIVNENFGKVKMTKKLKGFEKKFLGLKKTDAKAHISKL